MLNYNGTSTTESKLQAELCFSFNYVSGRGGDQHSASGFVSKRETCHRTKEETWPQPTQ